VRIRGCNPRNVGMKKGGKRGKRTCSDGEMLLIYHISLILGIPQVPA
jgi:hypothetical protein